MSSRREDVDLQIVLGDPQCAREWIRNFVWYPHFPPDFVTLEDDSRIYLDRMTDLEACAAAKRILKIYVIPAAMDQRRSLGNFLN